MDNELHNLSIHETRKLLDDKKVSSLELTEAFLKRINRLDPMVGAYVTVAEESAINQAKKADEIISMGNTSPLTGIPLQIKDNIATNGIRTTCSSRMLEHFIPPYHSKVTEKLLNEHAVITGKGNMDEFAMGSSTENSAFHVTRNPWDLKCVPGGSSGGPAAAVAASEAMGSLGSDTGGSIRQPASLCGIVGMKPTYGLVSRYGLVAFASSFDQIGPLTKNVTDCALLLKSIAGHDPKDSTSLNYEPPNYLEKLNGNIRGLRVGVPKEYFVDGIENKVKDAVIDALHVFESLGAKVDFDVSLPLTRYALPVYYIIAPSECSANLARYDGVKYGYSELSASGIWDALEKTREYGFGPEVKRRIMLGTYSLSSGYYDAYYMKAGKVRTLISKEFQMAFEKYDVLITPTSPSTAFQIGTKTQTPLQMYLSDICTIPANIAGIPAISVPCGFSEGLPIGLQIMGPALGEEIILQAAYAYELATDWHNTRPSLPID